MAVSLSGLKPLKKLICGEHRKGEDSSNFSILLPVGFIFVLEFWPWSRQCVRLCGDQRLP